jgi:hypothetical protein
MVEKITRHTARLEERIAILKNEQAETVLQTGRVTRSPVHKGTKTPQETSKVSREQGTQDN